MPKFKPQKLETIISFCNFLEGGAHPQWPLEIFLEISNVCDLKCAMCAAFSGINPNRFLKIKSLKRGFLEIENLANLDTLLQHAVLVHCFGYGEATIHPRFKQILDHVLNYEVLAHFTTNGMHLTEDLCQFLVERKLFKVVISISGSNKQDYENVYLGGNFEIVLNGITRLNEAKKRSGSKFPLIEINSLGFQHHVDTLYEFIDLMANVGVNIIELSPLLDYTNNPKFHAHTAKIQPDTKAKMELVKEYATKRGIWFDFTGFIKWNSTNLSITVQPLSLYEIKKTAKELKPIIPPKDSQPQISTIKTALDQSPDTVKEFLGIQPLQPAFDIPCLEPFHTLFLRTDGQTIPCCFAANYVTPSLGDTKKLSGEIIWSGIGYQTTRQAILSDEYPVKICEECVKFKHYPKHHAIYHKVGAYANWFKQVFGQEFDRSLQERIKMLGNLSNKEIVEKRKLIKSIVNMGTAEHLFPVSGSIFTLPKRIKQPYSWVEHIPFAFFLIEQLKPKILVELGVHMGNSYNAFCQAVQTLKLDTQCYGVDTWQGDAHSGSYDETIYEELFAYQQANYQDFSYLLRATFDEMLEAFEDHSIDLLHIDGYHTYEAVKHDFESWLPKMSARGVIILHDTAVKEHGFGVWKLWEEISACYPSFNFSHGYGLGIVAVGQHVSAEFIHFLESARLEPFYQEFFHRLGHSIILLEKEEEDRQAIQQKDQHIQNLEIIIQQKDQHIQNLKTIIQQEDQHIQNLGTIIQQKDQHIQNLEAILWQNDLPTTYFAQLFIDTGSGFSEEQSIVKTVIGNEQQLEFDLSAYQNIKQLRFDPINVAAILQIAQITILDQEDHLHLISNCRVLTNFHQQINGIVFETNDPQTRIEDLRGITHPQKIMIRLKYLTIGSEVYKILLQKERELLPNSK